MFLLRIHGKYGLQIKRDGETKLEIYLRLAGEEWCSEAPPSEKLGTLINDQKHILTDQIKTHTISVKPLVE